VSLESGDVECLALNDAELHGLLTLFNLERCAAVLGPKSSGAACLRAY
jgi:hypothetical protein